MDITRTKISLGSHCCEKDCHFKKIQPFVLKYIDIEETYLHAYFDFFLLQVGFKDMWKDFLSEYRISRIFTRISSKENM